MEESLWYEDAGRLQSEFPDEQKLVVSTETPDPNLHRILDTVPGIQATGLREVLVAALNGNFGGLGGTTDAVRGPL